MPDLMAARRSSKRQPRAKRLPRYAVIMAGGRGTRFWPRSRGRVPKQLLRIAGRRTLLQETARRLVPLCSWRRILVVCSSEHTVDVRRQLPRVPADQVLVEPVGRNTAPCIALAAEWIAQRVGDAEMIVAPADHVIQDESALRHTLRAACDLAAQHDCLVTLGIEPTRAETGYGYIEVGEPTGRPRGDAFWVRRFHEKPSASRAKRYVAGGRHLWNSGIFVWKASVFRAALQRCLPDVDSALAGVWRAGPTRTQRLRRAYRTLRPVSVDVGVMQPMASAGRFPTRVAVVRARFDWNDVGSWGAMPEIWGCDARGNATVGTVVPIETTGVVVYSPDRLVALVDVHNVIVVDSPDALLICARERAQDVRRVTDALKQRGLSRYL
jgi:mannose-1-phosphate guanylyltransferase